MRSKVSMINDNDARFEETIIPNNEIEAQKCFQSFNPDSSVIETKWVYK